MKLQGVMKPDCKVDIQKHFSRPDYRAEKAAEAMDEHKKLLEREARTTVGAVKRLIQKVSSMSVPNEPYKFSA